MYLPLQQSLTHELNLHTLSIPILAPFQDEQSQDDSHPPLQQGVFDHARVLLFPSIETCCTRALSEYCFKLFHPLRSVVLASEPRVFSEEFRTRKDKSSGCGAWVDGRDVSPWVTGIMIMMYIYIKAENELVV